MLVTRVGGVGCALAADYVVETLRPLPVEPIARAADPALAMVTGVAMIRGWPVPVIDARVLLGLAAEPGPATRFVVVRVADRRIALVVDAVIDVRRIELTAAAQLPALLGSANHTAVSALAARDRELMVVLDTARVLPEAAWHAIDALGDRRDQGGEG